MKDKTEKQTMSGLHGVCAVRFLQVLCKTLKLPTCNI